MEVRTQGLILPMLLAVCTHLTGQDTLNFSTFLVSRIVALERFSAGEDQAWKPAWINDIEVRTETDRFDPDRQEYLLRFNFNSPRLIKTQKSYYAALQAKAGADRAEMLNKLMRKTYEDWLEAVFMQKKYALLAEKRAVMDDEAMVRQKMIADSEKDLGDYLGLKEEIREDDLLLRECGFRLIAALDRLNPDSSSVSPYEAFDDRLVSLEEIEGYINRLSLQSVSGDPTAETGFQARINALESEWSAELAESRQVVDFLQIRYNGPHDDRLSERLSAGLGLRLPLNGKNRLKMAEIKLELENLKQERELEQYAFSTAFAKTLARIRLYFDQYRLIRQQIDELQSDIRTVSGRVNAAGSPIWLLNLQHVLKKAEARQLEVVAGIYLEYIDLLDLTGALRWNTAVNYLEHSPGE